MMMLTPFRYQLLISSVLNYKVIVLFFILSMFHFLVINIRKIEKPSIKVNKSEIKVQIFKFDEGLKYYERHKNRTNTKLRSQNTNECNLKNALLQFNCSKVFEGLSQNNSNIQEPCYNSLKEIVNDFISNGNKLPILTLFTSWVAQEDKFRIHNNTVKNWVSIKPFIRPIVFTNDVNLAAECKANKWEVLPLVSKSNSGVPVLKQMFMETFLKFDSVFYGFANSDILFTANIIQTLHSILESHMFDINSPCLIIGQRTNVERICDDIGASWDHISYVAAKRGSLFHLTAEDYFITNKLFMWKDIPEVVIGRVAYDNWVVLHSIRQGYQVMDASKTLLAVHQTTKYGNQEGFRYSDSDINLKILEKSFGKIDYISGAISCAKLHTVYNEIKHIIIMERRAAAYCSNPEFNPKLFPIDKF